MFRKIKLAERKIDDAIARKILAKGSYGVLSTTGKDGFPYGMPLNYTYMENSICFHCGMGGHKLDNIKQNNRVSFCVVTKSKVLSNKFDTDYESIIAFGKAIEEYEDFQKEKIFISLLNKYSPEAVAAGQKYMKKYWGDTKTFTIKIDHITGKAYKK
jgi:hypothetical protein